MSEHLPWVVAGFLKMGFNSKVEVLCSKEFKVCGAIGPCTSELGACDA